MMRWMRRAGLGLAAAGIFGTAARSAMAQGNLRIGMTIADIPLTVGQTDQGGEGQRFLGYTVYDALINWNLTSATRPSGLTPGLATSWHVDPKDHTK
jgi:hypothetical protein